MAMPAGPRKLCRPPRTPCALTPRARTGEVRHRGCIAPNRLDACPLSVVCGADASRHGRTAALPGRCPRPRHPCLHAQRGCVQVAEIATVSALTDAVAVQASRRWPLRAAQPVRSGAHVPASLRLPGPSLLHTARITCSAGLGACWLGRQPGRLLLRVPSREACRDLHPQGGRVTLERGRGSAASSSPLHTHICSAWWWPTNSRATSWRAARARAPTSASPTACAPRPGPRRAAALLCRPPPPPAISIRARCGWRCRCSSSWCCRWCLALGRTTRSSPCLTAVAQPPRRRRRRRLRASAVPTGAALPRRRRGEGDTHPLAGSHRPGVILTATATATDSRATCSPASPCPAPADAAVSVAAAAAGSGPTTHSSRGVLRAGLARVPASPRCHRACPPALASTRSALRGCPCPACRHRGARGGAGVVAGGPLGASSPP